MSLWLLLALLSLIKLPLAALMLWMPFRDDEAVQCPEPPGSSDGEGGARALPAGPLDPRPSRPAPHLPRRRGPHGSPSPPPPRRVRTRAVAGRRVGAAR
jgi:hypothetical protein